MGKLIHAHLAGLFNGMSQQAPTLRLASQAQNQINGWSSLVYGLTKRPPTRYVATLDFIGDGASAYHSVNRGKDERFIIGVHKDGALTVHGAEGQSYPIEGLETHKSYLKSLSPRDDIAMTSIADYTFIANKNVKVEMEEVKHLPVSTPASCTVTVAGSSKDRFKVFINGVGIGDVSGKEGSSAELKTAAAVANELREQINSHRGYSATIAVGDTFTFRRTDGGNFTTTSEGSLTLNHTQAVTATVKRDAIAYIYAARGVAEQNYNVWIDGARVAAYTSGNTNQASTYKTDVIASSIYSQISSKGFGADLNGSTVAVWKKDGSDFKLNVTDSWGGSALKAFKGRAQSFSELPARCFNGAILQIAGKTNSEEGTYWVRYETSYLRDGVEVSTTGVWKESRSPNDPHRFNAKTMPRQLVRRQNLSRYVSASNPLGIYFSLEYAPWGDREVGDKTSAPVPSFVGKGISGIFLFANRLGVLSGQAVCLSRVGEYFSFYPSTVTDSLDDEPIDVEAPSQSVATLRHALADRDNLMLFSDNQQFILNSGSEPLTSKTVNITAVLRYPCDASMTPIGLGQMAYFVSPRGKHVGVREYFIQADGLISDAPNVSDNVPTLIPSSKGLMRFCGVPNENLLFISRGDKELFVYKFDYNGDTKTQSSWSVWTFNRNVIALFEFDNELYLIFDDKSLERLSFVKDFSERYVDSFRALKVGERVKINGKASIYEPSGKFVEEKENGEISYNRAVVIGYPYEFVYEFSPLYLKLTGDKVGTPSGSSLLRNLTLFIEGHTAFKLTVKDIARNKNRLAYDYSTPQEKATEYSRSFLLRGEAKRTTVEIRSLSDKGFALQSASFDVLISLIGEPL